MSGVNCQEATRDALLESLRVTLAEAIEFNADAWDKQIDSDAGAGLLDALAAAALDEHRAGRTKPL